MHVVSVNVGSASVLSIGHDKVVSGIRKVPTVQRIHAGPFGLEGDLVANTQHHGGPDQAVYLYSAQDYDWWARHPAEAGEREKWPGGLFGENLTLSTFGVAEVRIGDRLEVGEVTLEVTAPRIPCATFAAHMQDLGFVRKFREARRPGCYARVLRSGFLQQGDRVQRTPAPQDYPTVTEVFDLWYDKSPSTKQLQRVLAAPLALRARAHYAQLLAARGLTH